MSESSAFTVTLREDDGRATEAPLLATAFTGSAWPPDRIRRRVADAPPAGRDDPDFQQIAQVLYDWLFPPGPVRDRWVQLDTPATTPRIVLDIQAAELADLPWELAGVDCLALTNGIYRACVAESGRSKASTWPFRILLVIGAAPEEQATLGIQEEIREIERTFLPLGRSVDVHRLDRPTKETLKDWVRSFHPHVFHFAGHGGKIPGATEGGIRFDPAGAESWVWSGTNIRTDLRAWRWTPQFVFLNACRSAIELEGSRSVQRGFLDAGVQAVLGMQADIHGRLAGLFAARLYKECAAGSTLEDAVFEARLAISTRLPSLQHLDWALPSLSCSAAGIQLVAPARVTSSSVEFTNCREFMEARLFANCREPRRDFTHWLFPAETSGRRASNLLLITGETRSGKSHLLKWCMETWVLGGARVRYIELHEQSSTLLDVLRQIRCGESDGTIQSSLLHDPLPREAFRRFNWELENIITRGEPGEWVEADRRNDQPVPERGGILPASSDKRLEPTVCARFLSALKLAAGNSPLVLVFDRLAGPNNEHVLFPADFEQLIMHLLLPIARDPASQVKVAIGATFAEQRDYKLDLLAESDRISRYIVPTDYSEERLVELAAEAVWFQMEAQVTALARAMLGLPDDERSTGLGRLKSFIDHVKRMHNFYGVRMR